MGQDIGPQSALVHEPGNHARPGQALQVRITRVTADRTLGEVIE